MKNNKLAIFEDKEIRRILVGENRYYSVVNAMSTPTGSNNIRRYWSDLKDKITREELNELYDLIVQLKISSRDGKKYVTDCAVNGDMTN